MYLSKNSYFFSLDNIIVSKFIFRENWTYIALNLNINNIIAY